MEQDNVNVHDENHNDGASSLGTFDTDNDEIGVEVDLELEERARVQSHYERKLRSLQRNASDTFTMSQVSFDDEASVSPLDETNLTLEQWTSLFQELERNTSVNTIEAEIQCCQVECLQLLVEYIRKSPRLMALIIKYSSSEYNHPVSTRSKTIPRRYKLVISNILLAARENSVISQLELHTCLGSSPQALRQLLAGNETLTSFIVEDYHDDDDDSSSCNSMAMAKAMAAGLQGNKALRHLRLFINKGRLDVMLSGLCSPRKQLNEGDATAGVASCKLETLSLFHSHAESNPKLGETVLRALACTPSIQRLDLHGKLSAIRDYYSDADADEEDADAEQQRQADLYPWIDYICQNIHCLGCHGLKSLVLRGVTFGTATTKAGSENHDSDSSHALLWSPHHERCKIHTTLEKVTLINIKFAHPDAMSMLFNFCGVATMLEIRYDDGEAWMAPQSPQSTVIRQAVVAPPPPPHERGEPHEGGNRKREHQGIDINGNSAVAVADTVGPPVVASSPVPATPYDYWTAFIRSCLNLNRLHVSCTNADNAHANIEHGRLFCSILQGARSHRSLNVMRLEADRHVDVPGDELRAVLQHVLQETPNLRELFMLGVGHAHDMIAGLASGLRVNTTLNMLSLHLSHLQAENYRVLIESLLENHTLRQLVAAASTSYSDYYVHGPPSAAYDATTSQALVVLLTRLFQVNTTLSHVALAPLNLQQGKIHALLQGLGDRQRAGAPPLKSLDMRHCQVDRPGFIQLTQTLMTGCGGSECHGQISRQAGVACHIVMPSCLGLSLADKQNFFRSIGQMGGTVKTLDFKEYASCLWNGEYHGMACLKLLLEAVRENKSICSFGRVLDFHHDVPIVKEIKYHLKLNHFGRQVLDSTNILPSLWPTILAPMTNKNKKNCNKNVDALFFFLREFFQRNSYPLSRQRPRPDESLVQATGPQPATAASSSSSSSPPPKRARVEL